MENATTETIADLDDMRHLIYNCSNRTAILYTKLTRQLMSAKHTVQSNLTTRKPVMRMKLPFR